MQTTTLSLGIAGMSCQACKSGIEKMLNKQDFIHKAEVSLLSNSANIEFFANKTSKEQIIKLIEDMGYRAYLLEGLFEDSKIEAPSNPILRIFHILETKILNDKIRVILSVILSLVILYISMLRDMFHLPTFIDDKSNAILQLFIALCVMHFGRAFFFKGFKALYLRNPNMDSLVALGSGAGFLYSLYTLLRDFDSPQILHNLYFESVCVILTFVMIGKYIEHSAKQKALESAKRLLKKQESIIYKLKSEKDTDSGVQISVDSIQKGDYLKVLPHSFIPIDATLLSPHANIDESNLSGESIPVAKTKGQTLNAGSINTDSAIIIKATSSSKDSSLSKIHHLIYQCLSSKANIANLADRISSVFVPLIIALATLSGIFWLYVDGIERGMLFFVSTLLISCPCALGLATPMAILFANARANKAGIFFKNANSLEQISHCNAFLFDKTGTLTDNKLHIQSIEVFSQNQKDFLFDEKLDENLAKKLNINSPLQFTLLKICASIESLSSHIIAKNICKILKDVPLYAVKSQKSLINQGMEAVLQNNYQNPAGSMGLNMKESLPVAQNDVTLNNITLGSPTKFNANNNATLNKNIMFNKQGMLQPSVMLSASETSLQNLDSTFIIGSKAFMKSKNIINADVLEGDDIGIEVYVARYIRESSGYLVLGKITLAERLKENAKELVEYLKANNIKVEILSGDKEANVAKIAQELGVDYKAGASASGKMEYIQEMKQKGYKVVMIGDGMNDSIAISSADVSIVMSSGSEISIKSGDIIYFNSTLLGIKEALLTGQDTLKNIKQNLIFAFIYNALCIPLAMGILAPFGIYLNPMIASLAMSLSSISVVLNSRRLLN